MWCFKRIKIHERNLYPWINYWKPIKFLMNQMDITEELRANEPFTMKYIAFSQQDFQKLVFTYWQKTNSL